MNYQQFIDQVQDLSDLELAALLCLVAKEHCLVETLDELVDDLAAELALIASEVFGLSYAVVSHDQLSSIAEFGEAILDAREDNDLAAHPVSVDDDELAGLRPRPVLQSGHSKSGTHADIINLDTRRIVDVIIAKDFNLAPDEVQIQALELIRRRRLFSRTTVHAASDILLFVPIVASSQRQVRLNKHLADRIFISHYHHPDDGFANLEELDVTVTTEDESTPSVTRLSSTKDLSDSRSARHIDRKIIDQLRDLGNAVSITPEIRRYLQDVVVFMRLERGVAGGISPYATTQFVALAKYLAPLHNLDFVTPSLVALAARKIYPHRILITPPERERSMQYGSDLEAIKELLDGVTPDGVVEAVINTVQCPL